MRLVLIVVVLLTTFACQKAGELALEKATGVKVEENGKKITIKSDEGEVHAVINEHGKDNVEATVTNEKGEKFELKAQGNTVRIEGAEGSVEWGQQKAPNDFPLPIISGAQVVSSASSEQNGKQMYHLMANVDKSAADVAGFYEKELKSKGFEVKRIEHKFDGDELVTLAGTKTGVVASMNATQKKGEAKTMLMLNWSPE